MSRFTLNNINEVEFRPNNGNDIVSMSHVTGGVSVDGYFVATTGVSAGNLRLTDGSITDTSGAISFGDENLSTLGTISANTLELGGGTGGNRISDSSGNIVLGDTGDTISFNGGTCQFIFPLLDGNSGDVLTTDGLGGLTFLAPTGGGTDYGASQGITLTGTSFSVNTGAGLEFGADASGTSTLQLNLYDSGNLQFYPGTGGVGSSVGLCSSILVPTQVTVGESTTSDRVVLTSGTSGGVIEFYNETPTQTMELFAGTASQGEGAEIHMGDNGGSQNLNLYGGNSTAGGTGPALDLSAGGNKGIEMRYYGETHDLPEINLFGSGGGTSTVKIYAGTSNAQNAGQIELYNASGSYSSLPIVQIGSSAGFGDIKLRTPLSQYSVTIGANNSATEETNFILPPSHAPVSGYVLSSDTTGQLSWVANGGGGGGTSINGLTDAFANTTNLVLGNENASATTGQNNTGIGVCALYDLGPGIGSDNVAVGYQALQNITNGFSNIAIGATALSANLSANNNIAIGHNTLYQYSGTEDNNTVVGSNSGSGITSSGVSGLTIIGASSGVGLTSASSNLTLIGYQVETQGTDTSNTVYIGNGQVGKVYMQGNVLVTSDGRDKTDVEDSTYGLNIVDNLRPVEFTWNRRPIVPGDAENTTNGQRSVGLIAQEVRDSLTEEENKILNLVNDSSEERFHMCYNNLIPILVKAVKDLKAEVDTLKQRMDNCSC